MEEETRTLAEEVGLLRMQVDALSPDAATGWRRPVPGSARRLMSPRPADQCLLPTAGPTGRLPHLAPLDGLRAIAVAAVMAFHTGASWAVGGFLGVDVFFVLSGFLITVLLLKEWQRRTQVSLRRFYARRALRLLPAVTLMCAVILVIGPVGTGAAARNALWKAVAGTMFYFQNWQQAFHLIPILQLTDHTWSLAIEEQFYLVWPTLLIATLLLARRAGRDPLNAALIVALTLAAASAIEKIVLWSGPGSQARIYYGTDTRADPLLIGAALGICYVSGALDRLRRFLPALAPVALLVIVITFGFAHDNSPRLYQGGLTAFALASAVLIGGMALAPGSPARARARRSSAGLARARLLRRLPLALAGLPVPAPGPARPVVGADPVRAHRSHARCGDDLLLRRRAPAAAAAAPVRSPGGCAARCCGGRHRSASRGRRCRRGRLVRCPAR